MLKGIWYFCRQYSQQQKGAITLVFVIALPIILSFCVLAFDGTRLLIKKSRLADALNEAALAIASISTGNPPDAQEKKHYKSVLDNYIYHYLPEDALLESEVNVRFENLAGSKLTSPIFDVRAKIKVNTLLPITITPAFSPIVEVANIGKATKKPYQVGIPTDYVFVVSLASNMDNSLYTWDTKKKAITLVRELVEEVIETSQHYHPDNKFTIIPFNVGVPVLWDRTKMYGDNELSDQPDAITGCSVLMVPKAEFANINYSFWMDKTYNIHNLRLNDNIEKINQVLDLGRYYYFESVVLPAMQKENPATNWQTLVSLGWCKQNLNPGKDQAPYSCEKNPQNNIYNSVNQHIIKDEFASFLSIVQIQRTGWTERSLFNSYVVDVEKTLEHMFDEKNIVNVPLPYLLGTNYVGGAIYDKYTSNLAMSMCGPAGHSANSFYQNKPEGLKDVKQQAYIIEHTNDRNELKKFQSMPTAGISSGHRGEVTAIIRAVPELLKGNNRRKALIIISSDRLPTMYHPMAPPPTESLFLKDRPEGDRLCDRIKSGVKMHTEAEQVDIFYIAADDYIYSKEGLNYWAQYCTGPDNAFSIYEQGMLSKQHHDKLLDALVPKITEYEEAGYTVN